MKTSKSIRIRFPTGADIDQTHWTWDPNPYGYAGLFNFSVFPGTRLNKEFNVNAIPLAYIITWSSISFLNPSIGY